MLHQSLPTGDVLSRILETLRLRSALSFVAEMRPNDAVQVPGEERAVRFHVVRHGSCKVEITGEPDRVLSRGDMILLPQGGEQIIYPTNCTEGIDPVPLEALLEAGLVNNGVLKTGPEPSVVSLLCGIFHFDVDMKHPILSDLPDVIVLREAEIGADPWLGAALRLLSLEVERFGPEVTQGASAILTRTVEIILIQSVRALAAHTVPEVAPHPHGDQKSGFLEALGNRHLSRALSAMHAEPEKEWDLNALAKEAGLSRSAFAAQFADTVGQTPMTYLAAWRVFLSMDMLRNTNLPTEEVAARVGYASPAAFSRRFKAISGSGPGAFRRNRE